MFNIDISGKRNKKIESDWLLMMRYYILINAKDHLDFKDTLLHDISLSLWVPQQENP